MPQWIKRPRWIALITLLLLLALYGVTFWGKGKVTLSWDNNEEPDIAGYRLYYGTEPRTYEESIDVGNVTTYTVSGLHPGTYFFAVKAYDVSGQESDLSEEISKKVTSQLPGCKVNR